MKKTKILPLRTGVGIVLLNNKNDIFVGKRLDNPKNFWQMPQGGIEKNENFLEAAKRELKEETGIKSVQLVKELNGWFTYDLPEHLLGKIWKGQYRGQKQKWFVMKFIGKDEEIDVKTKNPEFLEWKWINLSNLLDVVVGFKLNLYKKNKNQLELIKY